MKVIVVWHGTKVCFLDRHSGQVLDLEEIGPKVRNGGLQLEVLVGIQAHLPARLMLVRVPEEVIEQLDEWRGRTPWRILCEICAKVIALLIQHWFLVLGTWQDPYRSLVKAAKLVRHHALELLSALAGESSWQRVTTRLLRAMQACRLHRRLKHSCHPQLLLEGLYSFRNRMVCLCDSLDPPGIASELEQHRWMIPELLEFVDERTLQLVECHEHGMG